MALSALIFDVDGTLAETEDVHRDAFNQTFAVFGYDWVWSRQKYGELLRVAGGVERITQYLRTDHPGLFGDEALAQMVPPMHKAKTARYGALLASGTVGLRPGIERLCAEARAEGVILAIATTTSTRNIAALIDNAPGRVALDWFDVIAAGNDVAKKKPAPDIYELTLQRLGIPAAECVALEDSANGVASALGAAVPVVVTFSSYTAGQDFGGALAVADGLGERERPMTLLQGEGHGKTRIDLDLLRRWHGRAGG